MNLYAEARQDALWVRVDENRLDAAIAIRFKDQMREVCMQPSQRVILDLESVTFLDSSGLGAIVAVMKALPKDRKLELAALNMNVAKVFRLTRMDTIFKIHPTLEDAFLPEVRNAG
ncbi:STAS domain-containing protein [Thioclava sp. GXIMD2076]|uniref:STAS domain-containing protein n=1 Tax=unclassified Thioclava TaxID=2621713 RepID=UPI0030CBEC19